MDPRKGGRRGMEGEGDREEKVFQSTTPSRLAKRCIKTHSSARKSNSSWNLTILPMEKARFGRRSHDRGSGKEPQWQCRR